MSKKTYIYRLEAGYANEEHPREVEFFYAANSKRLIPFAQKLYKDKKYNKYKTIKVGVSKKQEEMRMITDFESWQLKTYMTADSYSERIEP